MPTRRSLLALAATAVCGACTSPPASAVGSLVDVAIVDRDRGSELAPYRYRGASYVAGRPGDRYAIRLVNRSPGRVLVVLSVDGVNAVSGETAAVGQTGYVLAPYGSAEITGWRKSYAEAAAFYFTALPDSYAARTDRPGNVGVIGAAVFRERTVAVAPPPERPFSYRDDRSEFARNGPESESGSLDDGTRRPQAAARSSAPPAPSTMTPAGEALGELSAGGDRSAAQEKLGTGHGEREYSPTERTNFTRASRQPNEVVQVRYDSYANLLAAGIIDRPYAGGRPQPFPGFAPDPR